VHEHLLLPPVLIWDVELNQTDNCFFRTKYRTT